jgi:hypothetical protein
MPPLRLRARGGRALLRRVRPCDRGARPDPGSLRLPRRLYPAGPGREDPDRARGSGGRAQAGDGALRGHEGLARAAGRPRSRGRAAHAGPGAGPDDGGGAPVRGHRQPGAGRRDHGDLRRPGRPREPRGARGLRGAAHARGRARPGPRAAPRRGARRADPHRAQLGRGGGALDRQRPAHGVHRGRPDDAPGRADGAARPSRCDAPHRREPAPGRGLHRGDVPRPGAGAGRRGADRGVRADRAGAGPLPPAGRHRARALPLRGPRRGGDPAPPGARARPRRTRAHGGPGRRARGRQVAGHPRVHGRAVDRGRAGARGPADRLPANPIVAAGDRGAPALLPGGAAGRRAG